MDILTRPIVSQKTSAAEAEGRLSKSFGIGRLCSASVIVCMRLLNMQMKQPKKYVGNSNFNQWKNIIREICPESLNIEQIHAE